MDIRSFPARPGITTLGLLVAILLGTPSGEARAQDRAKPRSTEASEAFFASGKVPRIQIVVEPDQLEKLRENPRAYVKATVREDDRRTYKGVGLKLKGAAGSFREWDDRPALTLNMTKFTKGGDFHGLVKFHLNNSVQDETYLNELLGSDLFRRSGIPTPRVSHARVWLNGRDVGLYVLKEGFDKPFLKRSFSDPTGNLYEGAYGQDFNGEMEKDEGAGPDDHSDLQAVAEAAADPLPSARWRKLEALIDFDAFATFMALERMTGHWDGYADSANNYRLYFDPRRGKAVFLPHGMDQIFNDPEAGLFEPTDKIASAPFTQSDRLRKRYRERVETLVPLMDPPDDLIRKVDEVTRKLRPILEELDPEQARTHAERVAELKERLIARAASLRRQIAEPEPGLQEFDERGETRLEGWWSTSENEQGVLEEVETKDGKPALKIRALGGEPCVASWRMHTVLGPGTYTIRARVRTQGVVKPEGDEPGGVGVGVSGQDREPRIQGTTDAQDMTHRFEVREDRKRVELVLELRATAGEVEFERDSLRLLRERPETPAEERATQDRHRAIDPRSRAYPARNRPKNPRE